MVCRFKYLFIQVLKIKFLFVIFILLKEGYFPEDELVPSPLMGHGGADYHTIKAFVTALHVCYDFILLYLPSYHCNTKEDNNYFS